MPTVTGRATDYITFTRTSNATVTDSNGFIEWAGHNLLTNSESFDASAWVKSSATVTANTDPAPNGTTTGDTIAASGANGTALQTWTAEAVPYTFGVWLRRKTGTGNIQIAADSGTYTTVTITSSWALYTVTQTPAAGSKSAGIRIVTSGDEVYAWGAHLYRSDLGGMVLNPARGDAYYPTTPRNLLGYTEDFSNAYWQRFRSTATSNAGTAPNGLQTADKLVPQSGLTQGGLYNTSVPIISGGVYTASVYVKAAELGFAFIALNARASSTTQGVCVNLVTGALTNQGASATYSATSVGGGWWRVSCSGTAAFTSGYIEVYPLAAAGTNTSYTGDGTSGIYLWGAQLSDSASLDAYSPVYGAAVTSAAYYAPRLDYDPVTLAANGLLVEEQRTNLQLHSEAIDDVFWAKFGATAAANSATAPSGTMTADTVTEDTSTGVHYLATGITLAANTSVSYSFYAKRSSGTRNLRVTLFTASSGLRALVNFDTLSVTNQSYGSSTYTSGTVTSVGGGWYRVAIVGIPSPTETNPAVDFVFHNGTGISYTGDGTSGFYVWGFQAEAGSFATSYIPTGSATATRTADVASVSTQAFPYSSTEGTIVVSADVLSTANTNGANLWSFYIDSNNIMRSWIWDGAKTTPRGTVVVAGSTSAEMTNGTVSANTPFRTGTALKQNDFAFSLNGASPATDPSGPVIAATNALWLGSLGGTAASSLNGHIRQITYLPRRISNAELQSRSA